MPIGLGEAAPDFTANTTEGPLRLREWKAGKWAMLFSHPRDFTPVCTTEIGYVARIRGEFDRRGCKVMGLSVDPLAAHFQWERDIEETQGAGLNFPLVADDDRSISARYGLLRPDDPRSTAPRAVFLIDPADRIRLQVAYPDSVGRNFDEVLRALDALQLHDRFGVLTPANWQRGGDVVVPPALSDAEARLRFPKGIAIQKPYLRVTPEPDR